MMDNRELVKIEQERLRQEEEKLRADRRAQGVCQYCGGKIKKTLFGEKCVECKKRKDY